MILVLYDTDIIGIIAMMLMLYDTDIDGFIAMILVHRYRSDYVYDTHDTDINCFIAIYAIFPIDICIIQHEYHSQ